MRKLLLSALFVSTATSLFAQKLDDIQGDVTKGKYKEAREKVDKFLTDPKNEKNANAWYYKGVVYSELGKDSMNRDKDYRMESFNALKKYQELDPKNIMLTLEQNARFFSLYEGYYNHGIQAFNAKSYDNAYNDFKNALAVKDYVYGKGYTVNGFKFAALDTQLVNLAGSAAMLAKQEDAGIMYFQQLANAKLKGQDFKDVYPILVDYYSRKKDSVNKAKYLAIGSELYPDNPYWMQSQLEEVGTDKSKRLGKLEEMVKQNPNSADLSLDYAIELFNYTYGKDKPSDYAAKQAMIGDVLKKSIDLNPTSSYANFVMTQHLSNQLYDQQLAYNAIKGTKPDDVKKKGAIDKSISSIYENLFGYSTAAYEQYGKMEGMKAADKVNYRTVMNQLVDYHKFKKQSAKAKEYEDKIKALK